MKADKYFPIKIAPLDGEGPKGPLMLFDSKGRKLNTSGNPTDLAKAYTAIIRPRGDEPNIRVNFVSYEPPFDLVPFTKMMLRAEKLNQEEIEIFEKEVLKVLSKE